MVDGARRVGSVSALCELGTAGRSSRMSESRPEHEHGMHLTAHLRRREAAGRELDDEGRRTRQVVVLPVDGTAREPAVVVEAHAGRAGVDPTGEAALTPGP